MTHPRLWEHPAVSDAARRLGAAAGGSVLLCYGLVHLLVWPGAPTGTPGERYRWNGTTRVLDWLPGSAVWAIGGMLLAVTVLGHTFGAAGLVGVPVVRRFRLAATGTGAAASLCLYAVTWPGLEPTPTDFSAGPVISGLLLACVLATAWARRYPPPTGDASRDRTGRNRAGRDRTGRNRAGRDRTGRNRTGRDRTGRDRTGRDRTGRDRTGRDLAGARSAAPLSPARPTRGRG
jgi:hypothetical protein